MYGPQNAFNGQLTRNYKHMHHTFTLIRPEPLGSDLFGIPANQYWQQGYQSNKILFDVNH